MPNFLCIYVYVQLPEGGYQPTEKLQRDFLWEGSEQKKKYHLVN